MWDREREIEIWREASDKELGRFSGDEGVRGIRSSKDSTRMPMEGPRAQTWQAK